MLTNSWMVGPSPTMTGRATASARKLGRDPHGHTSDPTPCTRGDRAIHVGAVPVDDRAAGDDHLVLAAALFAARSGHRKLHRPAQLRILPDRSGILHRALQYAEAGGRCTPHLGRRRDAAGALARP